MNIKIFQSLFSYFVAFIVCLFAYSALEPVMISAANSAQVVSRSQISGELSLTAPITSVTMLPAIPGMTGGTGNGSTYVNIITNNNTGYTLSIFSSSTNGEMIGDSQGGIINAYTPATAYPDFGWSVGANTGEFGYTVEASTTADLNTPFKDNGSICGQVSPVNDAVDRCWYKLSSAPTTIVNRATFTSAAGENVTIKFRAEITPNPNPLIPEDFYTATTTITATMN